MSEIDNTEDVFFNIPLEGIEMHTEEIKILTEEDKKSLDDFTGNTQEKVDVVPPPQEKPEDVQTTDDTSINIRTENVEVFVNKAKELLGEGFEDISITSGGVEIPANEYVKDVDTLMEVVTLQHEYEMERLKSSSVSTENLDQLQKDIVNIVAKGGNPLELIKLHTEVVTPVTQIDISTEEGQADMVASYMREIGNTAEDDIEILIEGFKNKGILEDKAIDAQSKLQEKHKSKIEKANEDELNRIEKLKKDQKEYKSGLKDVFKTNFSLNDKATKEFVSYATEVKQKEGESGYTTDMDTEYLRRRRNPEESAKLALFFKDESKYNELVSKKEVNKTQAEISKKVFMSSKDKKGGSNQTKLEAKIQEDGEILIAI